MLPLQGVGILVTRPEQQAMPLCRLLEAQGARTLRLPVIEVRAYDRRTIGAQLGAIQSFDLIVFVSANAVRFGAALLEQSRELNLAAIGPATARSLNQAGYRVAVQPDDYNTEGLLNHPQLQHMSGRKVLLIQGRDGRMLLQRELERRGAVVSAAAVYERVPVPMDARVLAELQARLTAGEIQVVTATSLDIGGRLLELKAFELRHALEQVAWLVPSTRVAAGLRGQGLRAQLIEAASAQDQDLVSALLGWRSRASEA